MTTLKSWKAFSKLFAWTYCILASLYCFLAFIPFTYLFVIVNPPYKWISFFAHHNGLFLWLAVGALFLSHDFRIPAREIALRAVTEFSVAVAVTFFNPMEHVRNDTAALVWSVAFLFPPMLMAAQDFLARISASDSSNNFSSISYSDAIFVSLLVAVVSVAAPRIYSSIHAGLLLVQLYDVELIFWVIVEHVTVGILIASLVNLLRSILSRYIKNPVILGSGVVGLVALVGLAFGCLALIENSLSLRGFPAWIYSISFAATSVLGGLWMLSPLLDNAEPHKQHKRVSFAVVVFPLAIVIYVPLAVAPGDDWNGIVHHAFALLLWVSVGIAVCRMRSIKKQYSIRTVAAVALATCVVYGALNQSDSLWAADIGPNKTQIQHALNAYSAENPSFALTHQILGYQPPQPCDTACKTLRQYSEIPGAVIAEDVNLVEHLAPAAGPKPNIFIIVIDSLRPDYVGAYNPKVDFTPNLDAFAHDNIVMRRAFTDYAGTSLSEPSIWSGALLLHAHYAQPFARVNSLEKLAHVDGYQMVVTYDAVLRELMAPSKEMVQLDTDKKFWGQVELSSTIRQLEEILDHRPADSPPILFYTQSMNVQVHADNDLPKRTAQNWQSRPGFDDRIAYTLHQTDHFFGDLVGYLRSKHLYDNSIILVTADHGDATGELGRTSHSTIIYPEVMAVPMIIHLPDSMRSKYVFDEDRISTLIDIAPSLYYLLGHRPINSNPLFGRPIFMENADEFQNYPRPDIFLASDSLAAYGILSDDGQKFYATYDSPTHSMLFDLTRDPNAQANILTPELKRQYDDRVLWYLQHISKLYGHRPTGG